MSDYKELFMYLLGAIVIAGFMTLLGVLIFVGIPEKNAELLYLSIGALITMAVQVVNYFYGSSKGSSDKTKIIANGNKPKA